jgi:drug/metabolite transporter superfamily protein YnfA
MKDISEIIGLFGKVEYNKTNVLPTIMWLGAFGFVICAILACLEQMSDIRNYLLIAGGISFLFPVFWYSYFAIKDPDRLQSERYQLQRQELQMKMLAQNQDGEPKEITDSTLKSESILINGKEEQI